MALLLVFSQALVATASGQATATIRGTVVADDGLPLEDAEILVRGVDRTVRTNATGVFRFNDAPVGQQVVIARRPGYVASERLVTIVAGQVALVDFRLEAVVQQLDSVTVTGERFVPFLIGYVHDTHGRPVEGADVLLAGVTRSIRTNASGRFRIDSLEAKRYQLTVRLPGYSAAHSLVTMNPAQPTEVALRLQAFAQDLGTIEVEADRRGLYGVVGTPDLQPVVGARVRVFGGGTSQLTDSAGRFAFPRIKPGDYLVAAEVKGMVGRTLQIEMPRNGRREVVLTMTPVNPSVKILPGERWANHDRGLALAFTSSFDRLSRSDLARHAGKQLCDIGQIRNYAGGNEATIVLNGERALNPWSLCAFSADELALVVIYPRAKRRRDMTCMVRGITIRPPPGLYCISVWTR